jgi:hypothetical protein
MMKGVVFQLLEDVAQREHGNEAWDELVDMAGRQELWSPSEQEALSHLTCANAAGDMDARSALRRTGRRAIPVLANMHPQLFANSDSTRAFLLVLAGGVVIDTVKGVIRWPAADADFRILPAPDGDFFLGYRSTQLKCTGRGDNRCLFWINFGGM